MTDQSVVSVNLRLLWELRASNSATEVPVRSHQHSVSEAVQGGFHRHNQQNIDRHLRTSAS